MSRLLDLMGSDLSVGLLCSRVRVAENLPVLDIAPAP